MQRKLMVLGAAAVVAVAAAWLFGRLGSGSRGGCTEGFRGAARPGPVDLDRPVMEPKEPQPNQKYAMATNNGHYKTGPDFPPEPDGTGRRVNIYHAAS